MEGGPSAITTSAKATLSGPDLALTRSRQLASADPPLEEVSSLRWPGAITRHGAAPQSLEDAVRVRTHIFEGPQVEVPHHRLTVLLAKQRLDVDRKSDGFIVFRQAHGQTSCSLRLSVQVGIVRMREREVLVHRANRRRTLAHSRRDSLGRAGSQVAHSKQSRLAGLERKRQPAKRLPSCVQVLRAKRPVVEHEAVLVEGGAT